MLHAWLDSWSGLASIVVGMQRHGYHLTLTHDRNGWRATFLHRSHVLHPWVGQVLHDGPYVWLVSRTGRDHAGRFPEMAEAVRRPSAPTLILDGEVAPFDEQFVSRFHLLHEETGELATPPVLVAFDCASSSGEGSHEATRLLAGFLFDASRRWMAAQSVPMGSPARAARASSVSVVGGVRGG